jgi:hypothetical protein
VILRAKFALLSLLLSISPFSPAALAEPTSADVDASTNSSQSATSPYRLGNDLPGFPSNGLERESALPTAEEEAPPLEIDDPDLLDVPDTDDPLAIVQAPPPALIPEIKPPTSNFPEAAGNGSLGYTFAIDAPGFRGVEPNLPLAYNSRRKAKTGGTYQRVAGLWLER